MSVGFLHQTTITRYWLIFEANSMRLCVSVSEVERSQYSRGKESVIHDKRAWAWKTAWDHNAVNSSWRRGRERRGKEERKRGAVKIRQFLMALNSDTPRGTSISFWEDSAFMVGVWTFLDSKSSAWFDTTRTWISWGCVIRCKMPASKRVLAANQDECFRYSGE